MIHPTSPDLEQAVHLFFSDLFLEDQAGRSHRIGMADIKKEFRKKAMLYHPDRAALLGENKGQLEEKFKQISDAYGILKSALTNNYIVIKSPASSPKQHANVNFSSPIDPSFVRPAASNRHFSGNTRAFRKPKKSFFHKGMVPLRRLRFGEFLFYKQVISWHTLIQAIVWQHRVRPRIGHIAVELNYMEPQDILTVLKNKNSLEPFCRAAVRLGFLDDYRRFVLLGRQRSYNLPLGKFFLDAQILDNAALEHHVHENRIHNFYYNNGYGVV